MQQKLMLILHLLHLCLVMKKPLLLIINSFAIKAGIITTLLKKLGMRHVLVGILAPLGIQSSSHLIRNPTSSRSIWSELWIRLRLRLQLASVSHETRCWRC